MPPGVAHIHFRETLGSAWFPVLLLAGSRALGSQPPL
jgi:hypothetical protein